MIKTIKRFKELAHKYGFNIVEGKTNEGLGYVALQAKNTNDKHTDWIKYYVDNDKVQLIGNTDQCNIWFYETRKDFTPEKINSFITELNKVFNLGGEGFLIRDLIDPEDWQVLAGVRDAYKDDRYFKNE